MKSSAVEGIAGVCFDYMSLDYLRAGCLTGYCHVEDYISRIEADVEIGSPRICTAYSSAILRNFRLKLLKTVTRAVSRLFKGLSKYQH